MRAAVRELVAELGSQSAAAKKIGLSQQTISRHLEGFPAGKRLAAAVATARGVPFAKLLGRVVIYDQTTTPRFDNLPGWTDALARARLAFPRVTDDEWAAAGRRSAEEFPPDGILEPELLLKLVENVRAIRSVPRKTEEQLREEMAGEGDAVPPPVPKGKRK